MTWAVTVPTLQMRTETQRRDDLPRPERCVRKAQFSGSAARLRKHLNRRGLRPSTPRVTRTRAGRPKISFRAARPPPAHRTPHFALGPYDPGVPETPASLVPNPLIPAGRPGPARPQPESEIVACAAVCAACSPGGGGRREQLGGRGPGGRPRATHASNLLFILSPPPSPLPHGVTSAPPGPSPRVRPLPVAQGTAERWRVGRVGGGYPGTPSFCAEALRFGSVKSGLGSCPGPCSCLPPARPPRLA